MNCTGIDGCGGEGVMAMAEDLGGIMWSRTLMSSQWKDPWELKPMKTGAEWGGGGLSV